MLSNNCNTTIVSISISIIIDYATRRIVAKIDRVSDSTIHGTHLANGRFLKPFRDHNQSGF